MAQATQVEAALKQGRRNETDWVFRNGKGEPRRGAYARRVFGRALKREGLRQVRMHDLRHTYASNLLQNGAHIPFVRAQLGHANIGMTMNTYGHLLPGGHRDTVCYKNL